MDNKRQKQINKLLNKNVNSYALLNQDEKNDISIILFCLKDENFDISLLEDKLNDKSLLLKSMAVSSPHIDKFTVKIDNVDEAISYLKLGVKTMLCFTPDVQINQKVVQNYLFLYFNNFNKLPEYMQKMPDVVEQYMNFNPQWNILYDEVKTKKLGLRAIQKNLSNIPHVLKDFPELRGTSKLWDCISKNLKHNGQFYRGKDVVAMEEALKQKNDDKFLKTLYKLKEPMSFKLIEVLKNTNSFKEYFENITLDENKENYFNEVREVLINRTLSQNKIEKIKKPKI